MPSSADRNTEQEKAIYWACCVAINHLRENGLTNQAAQVLYFFAEVLDIDKSDLFRLNARSLGDIDMETSPKKCSASCDVASDWVAHAATILTAAGRNQEAQQARDLARDLNTLGELYLMSSATAAML